MNMNHVLKAIEYARDGMFVSKDLTLELVSGIKCKKSASILVMFSYEMLPVLWEAGYTNVSLAFDKPRTSIYNIAKKFGNGKVYNLEEIDGMKFDVVIGNPPYGKNSNMAVNFVNKASEMSDNLWMVLPQTFRKPSIINRVNENLHLCEDIDVAEGTFNISINTCIQHWTKKTDKRVMIETVTCHQDFEFVDLENSNVCIGRVGRGAGGKVFTEKYEHRSPNSHYFIKAKDQKVIDRLVSLEQMFIVASLSTVSNPSLSKNDLINIYDKSCT